MDALGITGDDRPADLRPIPWADLGDRPANGDSGHLLLQICTDDLFVAEHVVRRVEEELAAHLTVAWTQLGAQRYTSRPGRISRREGRALTGFLDGTSNLKPRNSGEDAHLVFIDPENMGDYPQNPPTQPGGGGPYPGQGPTFPNLPPVPTKEPKWATNGTYMVVRLSTFDTTPWDDHTQNEQEQSVGRFKVSGASLDLSDEDSQTEAEPAFGTDQTDLRVALDAHIRKSNPRRQAEDALRRIFRRGYPIVADGPAGMRRGLAFICFNRTVTTQFEFIFRAWLRNADFPEAGKGVDRMLALLGETVLGGGYYFVPPVINAHQPWTWLLPEAVAQPASSRDASAAEAA